jgi:hypothetical protein
MLVLYDLPKNALGALVSCGLARGQRSNPVCSLHILNIYTTPVLMSGLVILVLSIKESSSTRELSKLFSNLALTPLLPWSTL